MEEGNGFVFGYIAGQGGVIFALDIVSFLNQHIHMQTLWVNTLGEIGRGEKLVSFESLSPTQKRKVEDCWKKQEAIDSGRFRVFLGKRGRIYLTTEFIYFCDQPEDRRAIDKVADELGGTIEEFWTGPHDNVYTEHYGTPEEREVIGENHGRKETQVSLTIEVKSSEDILELRDRVAKETESLWQRIGVSVI